MEDGMNGNYSREIWDLIMMIMLIQKGPCINSFPYHLMIRTHT